MQVEVSTAIAIGSAVFAAGGAWVILTTTARSARSQGVRIGKLEKKMAHVEGEMRGQQRTLTAPIPITPPDE